MDVLNSPLAFAFAFGAGLLSFLSPCVLPLVPGYLSYLSGTTHGANDEAVSNRRKLLLHALCFVTGFSLIFVALGALMGMLGYAFIRNLPLIQKVGGIILVAFGLHMLRLINLPFLHRSIQLGGAKTDEPGLFGSALLGTTFAIGWSPCVGVILSGILALAATSATMGRGAVLLTVYSLGIGLPFLLSALMVHRMHGMMRLLNRQAQLIERLSGVLMIVMGLIVFSNRMALINAYLYRFFNSLL